MPDVPQFEDWVSLEREQLRELAIEGLHSLAKHYLGQQNYTTGLTITRKLLALDPWRETAHYQQMLFLTYACQRRAALEQYDTYRQVLADKFHLEPLAETTALYEQIRAGDHVEGDSPRVELPNGHSPIEPPALTDDTGNPDRAARADRDRSTHTPDTDGGQSPDLVRRDRSESFPAAGRCDWGEAVDVSVFYERQRELATLQDWICQDRSRLILLVGMGGIGKTALSVKLAQTVQTEFEAVIWRSLRNAPLLESLLADLISFLSNQQDSSIEIGRLMHWLRSQRCLVILDNVETILQAGCRAGQYRAGYEAYGDLFQTLGAVQHQSCVLLTSREKLIEVATAEHDLPVRVFPVTGSSVMAQTVLAARGLLGSPAQTYQLAMQYDCNPFALKIVASLIKEVFEGDIEKFTQQKAVLFSGVRRLLEQQFERLSQLEQTIMYWLAIDREWTTIAEITTDLLPTVPRVELLEALESLSWRQLIERRQSRYSQPPLVMEYVTNRLVETVVQELIDRKIELFNQFSLLKTNVKEYLRETQKQLILTEISTRLRSTLAPAQLEAPLQAVLQQLQAGSIAALYAPGNLINLLCQLQLDLTGYDFSRLPLHHAYLQGKQLQSVNFQGSQFYQSSFTQATKNPFAIGFSPDGQWMADGDGGGGGLISVRRVSDRQLLASWQGHTNTIWSLVWSPDGNTFATTGDDGMIHIWQPTGQCLQTIQSTSVVWTVDWSPDGGKLVSTGTEACFYLWDAATGTQLKVIETPTHRAKAALWSPDGEWIVSGGDDGSIKFWQPQTGDCLQTLAGHTDGIWCLCWCHDGDSTSGILSPTLSSSSADHTIRLWNPNTGDCLQVLQGHSNGVLRLTWNPADRILASSSDDATIRLWDVQTGHCLRILQGHQNSVWSLAWSRTEPLLASGSTDYTLRLWQPQQGDCLQVLQGYSACSRALAWSADSQTLAAGADDHMIRLWHLPTQHYLTKLRSKLNHIWDVAWSPDRQTIAACSDNPAIEIWNPHTGECLSRLSGHGNWIWSVVWSADSRLLTSCSNDQTIRVWNVATGQCLHCWQRQGWVMAIALSPDGKTLFSGGIDCNASRLDFETGECLQVLQGHTGWIWSIEFSPDGSQLATGSEDGTVRLWDVQTGDCLQVWQQQGRIFSVAWSPDGRRVAVEQWCKFGMW